jgi:hypothetical protein
VMGAIYHHDVCTAVVKALNAGVDLLLVAFDARNSIASLHARLMRPANTGSIRGPCRTARRD